MKKIIFLIGVILFLMQVLRLCPSATFRTGSVQTFPLRQYTKGKLPPLPEGQAFRQYTKDKLSAKTRRMNLLRHYPKGKLLVVQAEQSSSAKTRRTRFRQEPKGKLLPLQAEAGAFQAGFGIVSDSVLGRPLISQPSGKIVDLKMREFGGLARLKYSWIGIDFEFGTSRVILTGRDIVPAFEFRGEYGPAVGAGIYGIPFQLKDGSLWVVVGGKYSFLFNLSLEYETDTAHYRYGLWTVMVNAWEGYAQIVKEFGFVDTYGGVRYSWVNVGIVEYWTHADPGYEHFIQELPRSFDPDGKVGLFAGAVFDLNEKSRIDVGMRFLDETSLYFRMGVDF